MFDEISGIDHILTDLHVGFLHSTSATKIRFKVDSGAFKAYRAQCYC